MKYLLIFTLLTFSLFPGVNKGKIIGKVSYYHPISKRFRKHYDRNVMYGIEGSYLLFKPVDLYASLNYFKTKGHSISNNAAVSSSRSKMFFIPFDIGFRFYYLNLEQYKLYFSSGIAPFYIHTFDDSSFVVKTRRRWALGNTIKGGFMWLPNPVLLFNLFFDGYILKANFYNTDQNAGRRTDESGVSVGIGFGFHF